MEEKYEFRKKFMRICSGITAGVSILLLSVMLVYAENKTVIVDNGIEENSEEETEQIATFSWNVNVARGEKSGTQLVVPKNVSNDELINYTMHYDTGVLSVSFKDLKSSYYTDNTPQGGSWYIDSARGEFTGEMVRYTFNFKEDVVLDFEVLHDKLLVNITQRGDVKKPIIMLDPGHGGSETGIIAGNLVEKELALNITREVINLSKNKPYSVVATRTADEKLTEQERLLSINKLSPDVVIGIKLASDIDDTKKFGMYAVYNDEYYNPLLTNVTLSDTILKNAALTVMTRAEGLYTAGEKEEILKELSIPGLILYAGYASNDQEASLLINKEYQRKIAEGIVAGLDSLYGE